MNSSAIAVTECPTRRRKMLPVSVVMTYVHWHGRLPMYRAGAPESGGRRFRWSQRAVVGSNREVMAGFTLNR